jgi:hypothetical protein
MRYLSDFTRRHKPKPKCSCPVCWSDYLNRMFIDEEFTQSQIDAILDRTWYTTPEQRDKLR